MPNSLVSYLDYYSSLSRPGYAVLVTGEWGVGKTYQVLKYFKKQERYYVSLFGVDSIDQINSEVISLCNPGLSRLSSGIDGVSKATASIGGFYALSNLPASAFNALFKQKIKPDRVLIFDDLERCHLCFKDLLGVINQYVEHHGFRVIVIAHDEKVENKLRYVKEKVFGQTISVTADLDGAYDSFVDKYKCAQDRDFYTKYKSMVLNLFVSSETNSLRVLRHLVEDLFRFKSCLRECDTAHDKLMIDLLPLFSAIDIEIRKGVITAKGLKNRERYSRWQYDKSNAVKTEIDIADESYPNVDFYNTLLSNGSLYSMHFLGDYDELNIQGDIDNSRYGSQATIEVPWKILSNFDYLDDDVVECARKQMNLQFNERAVTNLGDMLHMFALKMFMVVEGIEEGVLSDVKDECKEYVRELYERCELLPRESSHDWVEKMSRSYDGFVYWVRDTYESEFKDVLSFLVEYREKAFYDRSEEIWRELKSYMHTDSYEFLCSVAQNKHGIERYQYIPVFRNINPEEFVQEWLSSPKSNWSNIALALSSRYYHRRLYGDLIDEKEWARRVYLLLYKESVNSVGFQRLRIRRSTPDSFIKFFGSWDDRDKYKGLVFEFISDRVSLDPYTILTLE